MSIKLHSLKESENPVSDISEVHTFYSQAAKSLYLIKRYPIPVFAMAGLLVGTVTFVTFRSIELANWIWLATLIAVGCSNCLGYHTRYVPRPLRF
ncbi:MAG TPA: hypothetical protein VF884_14385 [Nitrososphaeraceae archaeon]